MKFQLFAVFNQSIRQKMIISALAAVILVQVLYTVINTSGEKKKVYALLQGTETAITDELSHNLADPLWNLDMNRAKELAVIKLNEEAFQAVLITDLASGRPLFGLFKNNGAVTESMTFEKEGLKQIKKGIVINQEKLWEADFYFTDSYAKRMLDAHVRNSVIATALAVAAIFVSLWILITIIVLRPLRKVQLRLDDIAKGEGDLTRRIDVAYEDEIGQLSAGFNLFISKIHDIIFQVRSNSEYVANAVRDISHTSAEVASGAEEQSSQAEEVATAVQEMSAAIIQNAQNATHTASLAEKASDKAREGNEAMLETQQGMNAIVESAGRTGEIVTSLAARAEQIGEIIQVINDIADQTNLLALNAAIEAARAGEQGRGFAVVADEVRKLAERTTKATAEISGTIQAIQSDTRDASCSMVAAGKTVEQGRVSIQKTAFILEEISVSVQTAMTMIHQIAAASEEQSATAEEISKNVEAISTVSRESAAGAEQLAATAGALNQQAENLRNLIAQFKLRNQL